MANKTLSDFPVLANLDAASVAHVQKELVDYQVPLDTLTQYVTENADLDTLDEKTDPADADMIGLMDSAASNILTKFSWANIKAKLKTYFDALYPSVSGWVACGVTFTYASADAPTFTMTAPGDLTGTYKAGMKIKLTQTTDKFFFISIDPTYSAGTGLTTFTLYGGTDYTLANAAITSPCYSRDKAPFGFPMSPAKWTIEATDTNARTQASPTQNTWYNLGSLSISIPVGVWNICYNVNVHIVKASSNAVVETTLSTANNSESDADMTAMFVGYANGGCGCNVERSKTISLASKTLYYLNTRTVSSSVDSIYDYGSFSKTIIRAICAYL
jgi:hypothetical protein